MKMLGITCVTYASALCYHSPSSVHLLILPPPLPTPLPPHLHLPLPPCTYYTPTPFPSQHVAATLGSGNLKLAVQLPEGEDMNEWIAVNSQSKLEHYSIEWLLHVEHPYLQCASNRLLGVWLVWWQTQ